MRIPIDLDDTLTLVNSGLSGPDIQQVGADPVWEDDSDATYVDLVAKYAGPSNPIFKSNARAAVATQSFAAYGATAPTNTELRIDVRLRGVQADVPFPIVRFVRAGDASTALAVSPPSLSPTAATTVTLTMGDSFTAWTEPDEHYIEIYHGDLAPRPGSVGDIQTRNIHVYEVRPYWWTPSLVAPPCRLFPREDGLGVGGGRHFPPPKSRQRSGRRFGYY